MARSRNIKPGFFKNDRLGECSIYARVLFAGLWCEADPRGILEDRPKRLKIEILPYDDCDVDALLSELVDGGFVQRYAVDGIRCLKVVNFQKHQNPHQNEKNSALPDPPTEESESAPVLAPEQHQSVPEDSLNTDSLSLDSSPRIPHTPQPPKGERVRASTKLDLRGFLEWYDVYPRHVARSDAEKAWSKLSMADREAAFAAIREQIRWPAFAAAPPDKIPFPATWLNGRRWDDEPPQITSIATPTPIRTDQSASNLDKILAIARRPS